MADNIKEFVEYFARHTLWKECPYDYGIQSDFDGESMVFGSVNRVIWNIYHGFHLEESHCTTNFINHFRRCMS